MGTCLTTNLGEVQLADRLIVSCPYSGKLPVRCCKSDGSVVETSLSDSLPSVSPTNCNCDMSCKATSSLLVQRPRSVECRLLPGRPDQRLLPHQRGGLPLPGP